MTTERQAAKELARLITLAYTTDTDRALNIRYIGPQASGTVQVDGANHQLLFKHGALAAEVADTSIQVGAGAAAGDLEYDEAGSDTIVEIMNLINASDNWIATPIAALLADAAETATVSNFLTAAATQAKTADGMNVLWDTSVFEAISLAVTPEVFFPQINFLKSNIQARMAHRKFYGVHCEGLTWALTGTGAGSMKVYHDETLIYTFPDTIAVDGTTGSKTALEFVSEVNGGRILIRGAAATTLTAASLKTTAKCYLI